MFTVNTYQDSLGHWHATLTDKDGNTVASVPAKDEYGFDSDAQAKAAADKVNQRYAKSYEYNR